MYVGSISVSDLKKCSITAWLNLPPGAECTSFIVLWPGQNERNQGFTKNFWYLRIWNCNQKISYNPDIRQLSLLVLIGNAAKSIALRELFGIKRARRFRSKRSAGDIHLYLDPSTTFHGRPIFIADTNLTNKTLRAKSATADNCHETIRRTIQCPTWSLGASLDDIAVSVYTRLLFPFVDIFCFFSADMGGFK